MTSGQWEVCPVVIKAQALKTYDVSIPANMLGMATSAVGIRDLVAPPVKTKLLCTILSDSLMTVEAQIALPLLLETRMALRTVVLVLCMRGANRSGHDELLEGSGPCTA